MDETQYRALCRHCDDILLEEPANSARQSVAWLHVIREHPVFLERYQRLFRDPSGGGPLRWLGPRRAIIEGLRILRQLFRAIGRTWLDRAPAGTGEHAVDVLFVSHRVSTAQPDSGDDFYFGNLPAVLAAHGRTVAVVLIDHTAQSSVRSVRRSVPGQGLRLVLPNTLGLAAELRLLATLWAQSRRIARIRPDEDLACRIRAAAAAEAMSSASFQALRIAIQVGELVEDLRAKTLITTYEGHAWERASYLEARRRASAVQCFGYQHAALFRLQHALRRTLGGASDPDVVLASGEAASRQLAEPGGPDVVVIGSVRVAESAPSPGAERDPRPGSAPVCLVIPEGLVGESVVLFEYAVRCAERLPDVTFLWRLHPILPYEALVERCPALRELPPNIEVSSAPLASDVARATWALYRGSTAILSATVGGAVPIYLRQAGEMSIDPLHGVGAGRLVVESVDDFAALVKRGPSAVADADRAAAALHCREIFSPLSPRALIDCLDARARSIDTKVAHG